MPKIRLRKERRSLIPILLCLLFVTSAWAVVVMRGRGFTVAAPGPVDDGTRIVWNFANTNNPTDDDSFVGTNTGTLGAGAAEPTWVDATNGMSAYYSFDGGDYVTNLTPQSLSAATATLASWVKSDADTAASAWSISISEATYQSYISLGYRYSSGQDDIKVYFVVDGVSKAELTTDGTLATDYLQQWHHIALTLDGTNAILFVDGTSNKSVACTNSIDDLFTASTPATRLDVGAIQGIQNWNGGLDSERVYNKALSTSEISDLFWTTATNHGWSKWDYDNSSDWSNTTFILTGSYSTPAGGAMADTSPQGNHATLGAGGAAATHDGDAANGFWSYDSTDVSTFPTGACQFQNPTVMAWVRMTDKTTAGPTHGIVSSSDGGNNQYFLAYNETADRFIWYVDEDGGGDWKNIQSDDSPSAGTWYHVAATRDGSTIKMYVDGVIQAATATASKITYDADTPAQIGRWADVDSHYWYGDIDEVRIYGSALASNQIYNIYNDTKFLFGL